MRRGVAVAMAAALVVSACASATEQRVVVAAGTTIVDSGFIEAVVDMYLAEGGQGQISIVGLSTEQALAYASAGTADVTITHDRDALNIFLSTTPGASASPVFSSRFVFVGPPGLSFEDATPSGILNTVVRDSLAFVSRDDGSGTHAKELELWSAAGVEPPAAPAYIRTGTGMGATLQVASERAAVTLAEIGVFLRAADQIALVALGASDPELENPYDVTVIDTNELAAAADFVNWLLSDGGRAAIQAANEVIFGEQVYAVPSR